LAEIPPVNTFDEHDGDLNFMYELNRRPVVSQNQMLQETETTEHRVDHVGHARKGILENDTPDLGIP
jgi:hypothetical protein